MAEGKFVFDDKMRYQAVHDLHHMRIQYVYRAILISWIVGIALGAGFVLGVVGILRWMGV